MQTKQKAEQAVEVDEGNVIIEDEDDHGIDLDSEEDDDDEDWAAEDEDDHEQPLYDSPLDQVDEVLHLGQHLSQLQQVDEEFYKFLLSQIADEMNDLNTAMHLAA